MPQLLRMPEVAAGGTTAVLATWSVAENTAYAADDTLAEIETDKATVDLEAETDGVILKALVAPGAQVDVGDPIALIGTTADQGGDLTAMLAALGVSTATVDTGPAAPATSGDDDESGPVIDLPDEPAAPEGPDDPDDVPSAPAPTAPGLGTHRVFASPLARKLALDAGVTLEELSPGSGPGGRVRRCDVQALIARRENPASAPSAPPATPAPAPLPPAAARPQPVTDVSTAGSDHVDQPHSKMRRLIASRLTESKQTVPHFYLDGTARVDKLLALRRELNDGADTRISLNDLVVKAAARAHTLLPEMNVIWTPDALRYFTHVDTSIAVASERGLVTPTLRSVDTSTITAVATQARDLVERANSGKLKQHELQGGSLSISNLGMFGTEKFGAIINPPQSAILAVGAAQEQPVIEQGDLAVGTVMRLTLSVDHRAVDGHLAAHWLRTLIALIEQPVRILA